MHCWKLAVHIRNYFLDAKDKKGIIRGWSRVALELNGSLRMQIPIEKIKAKYQNLQATYRKISQAEIQTTGNVKLPKKPSFFDALVDHFGNRQGMAHRCLNSSELANRSDEQSLDSDSGDEAQPVVLYLLQPQRTLVVISKGIQKRCRSNGWYRDQGGTRINERADGLIPHCFTAFFRKRHLRN